MKAQRAQLCEISCFYQYAHHVIIDVASLLDEAALPEASSPYVVGSLDEAASHNEAALIDEAVLLEASSRGDILNVGMGGSFLCLYFITCFRAV